MSYDRQTRGVQPDVEWQFGQQSIASYRMSEVGRMKIGLPVPSSNTVVEVDFARCVGDRASVHTARMHLLEATVGAERAMVERSLPQAIEDLASLRPDVVVFACTSGADILGLGERDLIAAISAGTGSPVVITNDAAPPTRARPIAQGHRQVRRTRRPYDSPLLALEV